MSNSKNRRLLFTSIIGVLFLWNTSIFSQATFIDSLELLIPKATIEERVKLKYEAEPYLSKIVDVQERLQQAQEYVDVATRLNDSLLLDHAYYQLGAVYKIMGDTLKSKQAANRGKSIASQYGWSLEDSGADGDGEVTFATAFTAIYKDSSRTMDFDSISRFVPNEFLRALGKSDITQITLGDTVEKEVTVFFSDIRDYTALSEQLSPEENFQFVNAYNGKMGPIIQKNQGFVNQYLGDGIMAIFPDTPTNALRSAIEMQRVIRSFNQGRISKGQREITVGMGLHTGSLIMGITGDENRLDATTISDSVNSAARIESLTKYYGTSVLLSEVTLKKIKNPDEFHFRYLGEVQVKGKQKPLKIYECFDADLPEIAALKLTTLDLFNAGIQHYFNQSFAQAVRNFEEVITTNPSDKTAKLFLIKAKQLEKMGVAENWTGVELMGQK